MLLRMCCLPVEARKGLRTLWTTHLVSSMTFYRSWLSCFSSSHAYSPSSSWSPSSFSTSKHDKGLKVLSGNMFHLPTFHSSVSPIEKRPLQLRAGIHIGQYHLGLAEGWENNIHHLKVKILFWKFATLARSVLTGVSGLKRELRPAQIDRRCDVATCILL